MFTQTIKNWLHKMFAWWPWKRSTEIKHTHVDNPFNKGTTQESVSRSTIEEITPQAGIASRLSTIDEWPETPLLPPSTLPVEMAKGSAARADDASVVVQAAPSPQQRLEFLQYLVKRGIVNEGFEENKQ